MHYYKRPWKQSSGSEQTGEWGEITTYFETNETHYPVRQLDVFANGNALKYDTVYYRDRNGALFQFELNPEEFEVFRITAGEFESAWENTSAIRFPDILITEDVADGQPHLAETPFSVGEIIAAAGTGKNKFDVADELDTSVPLMRQAMLYCEAGQCLRDKPPAFCHNCTHQAMHEKKTPAAHQTDRWREAEQLLKKYTW